MSAPWWVRVRSRRLSAEWPPDLDCRCHGPGFVASHQALPHPESLDVFALDLVDSNADVIPTSALAPRAAPRRLGTEAVL